MRMFTGLIEAVGRVARIYDTGSVVCLVIESPFAHELKKGQSVCVSGACLTVVEFDEKSFKVEMMNETLKRTNFHALRTGSPVNLERALRVGDRLDGHFLLGHVDCVGAVREVSGGMTRVVKIVAPREYLAQIVPKGSVALDGVSLTVIDVERDYFSVGLIPTTLSDCTLGKIKAGDELNIETDIIGKYILARSGAKNEITLEKLSEMGW